MSDDTAAVRERLDLPSGWDGCLWPCAGATVWRNHHHPEVEANLVLAGHARYRLGDRCHPVGTRSLIWLLPDQPHQLIERSPDLRLWILVMRPAAARRWCPALVASDDPGGTCRQLADAPYRELRGLWERIAEGPDDAGYRNAGIAFAVAQAWRLFTEAKPRRSVPRLHPAVVQALDLLRTNDLPTATLARRCGLSASRLGHLVRDQLGATIPALRNRQRLERYGDLRRRGGSTILADALAAGFGSYVQFHRVFTATFGESPATRDRRREPG